LPALWPGPGWPRMNARQGQLEGRHGRPGGAPRLRDRPRPALLRGSGARSGRPAFSQQNRCFGCRCGRLAVSWPAAGAALPEPPRPRGPRDEAPRLRNNDDAGTAITDAPLSELTTPCTSAADRRPRDPRPRAYGPCADALDHDALAGLKSRRGALPLVTTRCLASGHDTVPRLKSRHGALHPWPLARDRPRRREFSERVGRGGLAVSGARSRRLRRPRDPWMAMERKREGAAPAPIARSAPGELILRLWPQSEYFQTYSIAND